MNQFNNNQSPNNADEIIDSQFSNISDSENELNKNTLVKGEGYATLDRRIKRQTKTIMPQE